MPAHPSKAETQLRGAVIEAVEAAYEEGCPVACGGLVEWEEIADVAIRRWRSIGRRRSKRIVHADRVEDLAKGLRDHFSPDRRLVGPLMTDYRCLASRIADVLSAR